MNLFSVEQLASATSAPYGNAKTYHQPLLDGMTRFNIDNLQRQAAFLATVAVESQHLSAVEEGLYYKDASRLARIYPRAFKSMADAEPYARNPKGLGELLYKGYWGRGLIQLTWRRNYERASEALGYDSVGNPALVAEPKHAALTAAWYWYDVNCNELMSKRHMASPRCGWCTLALPYGALVAVASCSTVKLIVIPR